VLAAWLGDDEVAINSLFSRLRETAIEGERDIEAAARGGNLAKLAAEDHRHEPRHPGNCQLARGSAEGTMESASDPRADLR
jgi:hypothetical protein